MDRPFTFTFTSTCLYTTCSYSLYRTHFCVLLLLLLLLLYLSPLCRVFTIIYLQKTMFLGYTYSVAAVLYLQSVLHVMLFRPWNMFCTFTLVLSEICVHCPIWLFFGFLDFVLSPYVVQVLSEWFWDGITFGFTLHMRWISIIRSLYFRLYYYYYYYFHHTQSVSLVAEMIGRNMLTSDCSFKTRTLRFASISILAHNTASHTR